MSFLAPLIALLLTLVHSVEHSAPVEATSDLLAKTIAPQSLQFTHAAAIAPTPSAPSTNAATAATPLANQFITPVSATGTNPVQQLTATLPNSHHATLSQNVNTRPISKDASGFYNATNSENVKPTAFLQPPAFSPPTPLPLIAALADQISALITFVHTQQNPAVFPQQIAAGGASYGGGYVPGPSQNISQLQNTTITNSTITGGSITAASISGTIANAINSALAAIDTLSGSDLTYTRATFTDATTTNLVVTGSASLPSTTVSGDLTVSGTITGSTLAVAGLASGGAVAAPYFTATSTTATSTFATSLNALGPAQFANSANFFGLASFGATGTSTIATNGTISTPLIIAQSATFPSLTAGAIIATSSLIANSASIASLTSPNATIGALTATSTLTISGIPSALLSTDATGNVVATTTLASSYLSLPQGYTLRGSAGGAAEATSTLFVASNGNVGVGTVAPSYGLDVSGTAMFRTTNVVLRNASPSTSYTGFYIDNNGQSRVQYRDGSGNAKWEVGHGGSSANYDYSIYNDVTPGYDFYIQASTGNVGIGTTSPDNKLVLTDTNSSILKLNTTNSPSTYFTQLVNNYDAAQRFYINNSGMGKVFGLKTSMGGDGNDTTYIGNYYNVALTTGATDPTSSNVRLFVTQSGNVGIGTTSPTTALQVNNASSVSAFTGTPLLPIFAQTSAMAKYAGVDFGDSGRNASNPLARIGMFTSGSGSYLQFGTSNNWANGITNTAMTIDYNGNIGVGTTSPSAILTVSPSSGTANLLLDAVGSNQSKVTLSRNSTAKWQIYNDYTDDSLKFFGSGVAATMLNNGSIGIGTTNPNYKLQVETPSNGSIGAAFRTTAGTNNPGVFISTDEASGVAKIAASGSTATYSLSLAVGATEAIRAIPGGNVGIGTTTPTAQLSTTGTVRFSNFGAGTLTTDASGNLSVSSDERLKNVDGHFDRGLSDILTLSPILYHWNATSGLDQATQYAGFSAQNVQPAIPEAVGEDKRGYLTLQDRPLIATITGTFKANLTTFLTTWLASSTNGITDFFASIGHFHEVHAADELCVGSGPTETCVTQPQLAALLSQAGAAATPISVAPSGSPQLTNSGNPVTQIGSATLTLNGTDPLQWPVNTAWHDNLGALFTHGGISETVYATSTIDTSVAGTTTIDYWVTWYRDPSATSSALTLHATRAVVVQ